MGSQIACQLAWIGGPQSKGDMKNVKPHGLPDRQPARLDRGSASRSQGVGEI